jgi:hypothetical protein
MAAGVHLARHGGAIGDAGFFLDRQRVHVGAQADCLQVASVDALAALDDTDHAGAPEARGDFIAAEFTQPVCDESRGAMHVVHQLRMRVQIAAPFRDVGLQIGDAVDDRHGKPRIKM